MVSRYHRIEAHVTDIVLGASLWLAPIPSAVLVSRATIAHLNWHPAIGLITSIIIETLGFSSVSTALNLWNYNRNRRKVDEAAPFTIAAALVGIYLLTTIGLTVLLDIIPSLSKFAPAIFPLLSLIGATNLGLRTDQERRLIRMSLDKEERKAKRQGNGKADRLTTVNASTDQISKKVSDNDVIYSNIDKMNASRKAKMDSRTLSLLDILREDPDKSISDLSRMFNVSRQTIYTDMKQLEQKGHIRKNGNGIEVVK